MKLHKKMKLFENIKKAGFEIVDLTCLDVKKVQQQAIELAKAGSGNIVIKEGTYNQNGITIDGDNAITIIGQGNVIIDGTGLAKASVFTVATKDVTIKNIKFENGNAEYGGALNIQGSSATDLLNINVIIENCSFNNSKATRGGAVYAYCTKGNLRGTSLID